MLNLIYYICLLAHIQVVREAEYDVNSERPLIPNDNHINDTFIVSNISISSHSQEDARDLATSTISDENNNNNNNLTSISSESNNNVSDVTTQDFASSHAEHETDMNDTSDDIERAQTVIVPNIHIEELDVSGCSKEDDILKRALNQYKANYKFIDVYRGIRPSERKLIVGEPLVPMQVGDILYQCNIYKGSASIDLRILGLWKLRANEYFAEVMDTETYDFLYKNHYLVDPTQSSEENSQNYEEGLIDDTIASQAVNDNNNDLDTAQDTQDASITESEVNLNDQNIPVTTPAEINLCDHTDLVGGIASGNVIEIFDDPTVYAEVDISSKETEVIHDDGNTLNRVVDQIDENTLQILGPPPEIIEQECTDCMNLKGLYDRRFETPELNMLIAGRTVSLMSYHYRSKNSQNKSSKSRALTFIDKNESVELYRWELKGAVVTQFQKVFL